MANALTKTQAESMRWFEEEIRNAEMSGNWIEFRANGLFASGLYGSQEKCIAKATEEYEADREYWSKRNDPSKTDREFDELKQEHIVRSYGYNSNTLKALEKKGFIQILHLESDEYDEVYHSMDVVKVLHF